ncbi:hypothetical protein CYY_000469 [Polysphondylium violaceum]|uniref:ARID/BRIGHT DNA binding domain-containing protein n=1 Tax=Polysphondylium violaceum TaxID=133409 RepID=A0A8J4VBG8_9MYCE|nr:hypothetical protein CYY_000469 [Polysphondylium violaceum]
MGQSIANDKNSSSKTATTPATATPPPPPSPNTERKKRDLSVCPHCLINFPTSQMESHTKSCKSLANYIVKVPHIPSVSSPATSSPPKSSTPVTVGNNIVSSAANGKSPSPILTRSRDKENKSLTPLSSPTLNSTLTAPAKTAAKPITATTTSTTTTTTTETQGEVVKRPVGRPKGSFKKKKKNRESTGVTVATSPTTVTPTTTTTAPTTPTQSPDSKSSKKNKQEEKKVVVESPAKSEKVKKTKSPKTTPTKSTPTKTTPSKTNKSPKTTPSKTTPTLLSTSPTKESPKKRKHNSISSSIPIPTKFYNKGWSKTTIIDWKIPEAPVFYPTVEEFKSPLKYIESIRPIAEKYGICKIIPPFKAESIHQSIPDAKEYKFKTKIQNIHQLKKRWNGPNELFVSELSEFLENKGTPMVTVPKYDNKDLDLYNLFLEVNKRGGLNEVTHTNGWQDIIKLLKVTDFCQKPIQTLKTLYQQYLYDYEVYRKKDYQKETNKPLKDLADHAVFVNLIIAEFSRYSRIQTQLNIDQVESSDEESSDDFKIKSPPKKSKDLPSSPSVKTNSSSSNSNNNNSKPQKESDQESNDEREFINVDESEQEEQDESEQEEKQEEQEEQEKENTINNNSESESESESEFGFYEGNIYSLEDFEIISNNFSKKWFPEGNNDPNTVENEFWRIVENGDENVQVHYGSDLDVSVHGSGFSRKTKTTADNEHWNLNQMPKMEGSLFSHLTEPISGVTDPMMYIGMLFSAFCWHNEDNYLYSINYLHKGTYKTWYGVPGSGSDIFEKVMKATVPDLFSKTPNLLYLLITMISPDLLKRYRVPVYKTLQAPGEYVVTFPQAYHAGFSHGFTVAEAVNFAPADWIPFGSSSIERYQKTHRSSVFSHEQLLYTIANREPSLDLCQWLSKEFEKILEKEENLRASLVKQYPNITITPATKEEKDKMLANEPNQCDLCKYDCFLSYVICSQHPTTTTFAHNPSSKSAMMGSWSNLYADREGAPQITIPKVSCVPHCQSICDCPISKKKLVTLFSIDDLKNLISQLNSRIEKLGNNNNNSSSNNNNNNSNSNSTTSTTTNTQTPTTRHSACKAVYKFPTPSSNDIAQTPPFNLIFSKNRKTIKK